MDTASTNGPWVLSPARISRRAVRLMRSPAMWVALLIAAASLSIAGVELWHEKTQHKAEIRQTETATFNLARSLVQHAEDTFELADSVLAGLVERLETDGRSPAALDRIGALLRQRTAAPSRLHGLFVYDESGAWLVNSVGVAPPGASNADRAYFIHHRASPDRGPFLGKSVRSRAQGDWIVTVSRRYDHPDGSFAGVVLATVSARYFSEVYSAFDLGRKGAVTLIHPTGSILARFPHDEAFAGRALPASSPFFQAQTRSGTQRYRAAVDGVERIGGFHTGRRFPIVISTAVSVEEALAEWQRNAIVRMTVALTLGLVIALLGWRLVRYMLLHQRNAAALKASEADFRLLAESSEDMVTRVGPDGSRRYVSPAVAKLLGRTPQDLLGTRFGQDVEEEDRPEVEREMGRLLRQDGDTALLTCRVRRADGAVVWLESSMRIARDPRTGAADGLVAITRDVTERKRLEGELKALARTDGLTGLANRRTFDAALDLEWGRAKRDGTPLSLVMLDLDRFKLFNDTYGHQAGDHCLVSLARIMQQHLRRPGDLAARYGGEEFAVILPNTDEEGAGMLAERIRADLAALAIPHAGNPPAQRVTLSAGISSRGQLAGTAAPGDLVVAADRELYRAKSLGRNRISRRTAAPVQLAG